MHALETPVGMRDRPLLLRVGLGGEDDIGEAAHRLGDEVADGQHEPAVEPALPRRAVGMRAKRIRLEEDQRGERVAERPGDLRRRESRRLDRGQARPEVRQAAHLP